MIAKLQEERHFGEIRRSWMKDMIARCLPIIEKLGNLCNEVLKLEEEIFTNLKAMKMNLDKYKECTILLQEVISLKVENTINLGIFKTSQEPLETLDAVS